MRRIGYVIEGLRVSRSSMSNTAGIRKHSVPVYHVNSHKPMIALNGKIIDIERNDRSIDKCFFASKKTNTEVEKLISHHRFVNNSIKRRISSNDGLEEVNIIGFLKSYFVVTIQFKSLRYLFSQVIYA